MSSKLQVEEESHAIEFNAEIIEDENLTEYNTDQIKIETNIAFNEAEAFIREQEHEREVLNNESETAEDSSKEALENTPRVEDKKVKKTTSELKMKSEIISANDMVASRTTIRYNLSKRTALELPNPVYTCESGGKVVISIEVNEYGKVTKATYNKKASTTENGCLIDSALEYARTSKFTTKKDRKKQPGSISYNFPGQQH